MHKEYTKASEIHGSCSAAVSAVLVDLQQPALPLQEKIPGMQSDLPSSVSRPEHLRGGITTDMFTSEAERQTHPDEESILLPFY